MLALSQVPSAPLWLPDWLEQWTARRHVQDAAIALFDGERNGDTPSAAATPMFDRMQLRSGAGQRLMSAREWARQVDISEDDKEFLIKAEMPGVKKEDLEVSVKNGVLNISGECKHAEETKTRKEHRIDRCYDRFVQNFTLPDDVNAAKISAEFKDGLMETVLLKPAAPVG